MVDRIVSAADDDEDPNVIEHVYSVRVNTVENGAPDPFARKGEDIRKLSDISSNFKRSVSNKIKKSRQSASGDASSKQIEDVTEVTGYAAFDVIEPPHSLEALAQVYEMSAAHYAAVNAKVDNIVGLGWKLVETNKTKMRLEDLSEDKEKLKKVRASLNRHRQDLIEQIDDFNQEDTFTETLVRVWKDFETMGNGYLEVGRKKDGSIGYVGHIPAQTMRVRRSRDGFVQISANKAQFFRNFGDDASNPVGSDTPNEVIHVKNYSPTSSYYGVPDIVSAQQAVAGDEFSARFNLEYFENKAVPRHLITLKGANLGTQAQTDLLSFFETGLKGQNHRSLFIPLPADSGDRKVEFKIEPIEAGAQDSSFNNYRKGNKNEILMVHRVPITKVSVGEGVSLAVARDADKTFKEQVCGPRQSTFEKKLNRILKEMTDAFELDLDEMTLTDEDTQSKIDERLVKAGIRLPNEPRVRDGYPALPDGDKRVDLSAKDKVSQQVSEETTQRERDSRRSAEATDSNGEGRNAKGDGRAQE